MAEISKLNFQKIFKNFHMYKIVLITLESIKSFKKSSKIFKIKRINKGKKKNKKSNKKEENTITFYREINKNWQQYYQNVKSENLFEITNLKSIACKHEHFRNVKKQNETKFVKNKTNRNDTDDLQSWPLQYLLFRTSEFNN